MGITTFLKIDYYRNWSSFWSRSLDPAHYQLVSGLFLRLLALIYFAAFFSMGVQIIGLAGSEGILPFADKLQFLKEELGPKAYWSYPNVFWINSSDLALRIVPIAGCIFSVTLLFNLIPRISLILLFVLYLSLFHAGQLFMNFQWDYLLLESGFLAIFLHGNSRIVIFLFRWLLFRFRFLSGISKLISNDPSWADFTALNYYFETQPLPHWGSWYAHQLPEWLLKFGVGTTLFIELIVPFMIFLPRGPRFFAAWATILLQVLIILTSNHNFFNFLTIALCLFLFDDQALRRVIPAPVQRWLTMGRTATPAQRPIKSVLLAALASFIVFISAFQMWEMFTNDRSPEPVASIMKAVRPYQIVHRYHVFPNMRTIRTEIIVEGSMNGEDWQAYEFKYKPGDPVSALDVVIPHQPRLDWMMWFVPMGPPFWPLFESFLYGLIENSPPVVGLLSTNPFPEQPPKYLRVSLYNYRFADPKTNSDTGKWWERHYIGPFFPLPWLERPPSVE